MKSIKKHIIFYLSVAFFSLPFYADVDTTSGMRGSVNVGGATIVAEPVSYTHLTLPTKA